MNPCHSREHELRNPTFRSDHSHSIDLNHLFPSFVFSLKGLWHPNRNSAVSVDADVAGNLLRVRPLARAA
jgi:hypothetical protein